MTMTISILTYCFRRVDFLRLTLPSMAAVAAGDDVECIVLDVGPTPGVDDLCRERPSVARREMSASTWRGGEARNEAARHATGDVLYFVDCDAFVSSASAAWLRETMARQGQESVVCAWGRGRHGRVGTFRREFAELGGFDPAARYGDGREIDGYLRKCRDRRYAMVPWPREHTAFVPHDRDLTLFRQPMPYGGWKERARDE